jgi:hypothetical protein
LPNGLPVAGNLLNVLGASFNADGSLRASSVQILREDLGGSDGEGGSVEGYVTSYAAGVAVVNGQSVVINSATVFENGAPSDVAVNRKLEAEGHIDAAGRIVAEKIQFEFVSNAGVTGTIDALDAAHATVTVLGVTVRVDVNTRTQDKSDAKLRVLTYGDLRSGDMLDVAGSQTSANGMLAKSLVRNKPSTVLRISGTATVTNRQSLLILGTEVFGNSATRYRAANGSNLTPQQFFALAANSAVAAKAVSSGGALIASELALQL